MKNTRCERFFGSHLPRQMQVERLRQVILEELTELQRRTLVSYYFEGKNLTRIAHERQVNKSTVCRTLKRAEQKIYRVLKY